jgi:hypothetical protein
MKGRNELTVILEFRFTLSIIKCSPSSGTRMAMPNNTFSDKHEKEGEARFRAQSVAPQT